MTFRFRTTGIRSIRIRPYWGVSVSIFHHVLKSPWPWFKEAFLRGNLFGSEGCSMLGDIQTCSSDWLSGDPLGATGQFPKRRVIVNVTKPDGKPIEDLGPAPRQIYPLVLVILPGDDDFYKENRDGNVGAFIGLLKICNWWQVIDQLIVTFFRNYYPDLAGVRWMAKNNPPHQPPIKNFCPKFQGYVFIKFLTRKKYFFGLFLTIS